MPGVSFRSADIPDLSGQVIIVTGGNAGLGLEAIRQLGEHHPARIYLAARSQEKAEAAIKKLRQSNPKTPVVFLSLELASFSSVRAAADTITRSESRLDILINNAGVMMTPEGLTKEGYEIQFGTNVMGPALFTELLLPLLEKPAKVHNPQARMVMLSSGTERVAPSDAYDFKELKPTMSHRHTTARYALSKLADVHYTTALAERHPDFRLISVHPGMVATSLHHNSTGFFLKPFLYIAGGLFATPVEKGALSQIRAAVSPDAKSGEFYGPVGVAEKGSQASRDRKLRESLFTWAQDELHSHSSNELAADDQRLMR